MCSKPPSDVGTGITDFDEMELEVDSVSGRK